MKDIDTLFIKQLAPMVPIIPIIAKADTMTVDERNHFMAEVYSVFSAMTTGFHVTYIHILINLNICYVCDLSSPLLNHHFFTYYIADVYTIATFKIQYF
jgi:hypothetical protein